MTPPTKLASSKSPRAPFRHTSFSQPNDNPFPQTIRTTLPKKNHSTLSPPAPPRFQYSPPTSLSSPNPQPNPTTATTTQNAPPAPRPPRHPHLPRHHRPHSQSVPPTTQPPNNHTLTPHTHTHLVSAPSAAIGVRDPTAMQCPSGCPVGKRDSGPVGPAYRRDAVPAEYTTPDRRDAAAGTTGPVGKREAEPDYESPVGINRREPGPNYESPVGINRREAVAGTTGPVGKREAEPEYESPVGINRREAFDTPVGAPVGKREAGVEV